MVFPAIICWDFDETLGYFRPMEFEFLKVPVPENFPISRIKPGIKELLSSLSEFTHVVTTAAIGQYARYALEQNKLLSYFTYIIGREDGIFTATGKDYKLVGERFGITEDNLSKHLLIIGNDYKKDIDAFFRQIVMIYDAKMVETPAEILQPIIRKLFDGEKGVEENYIQLLKQAKPVPPFDKMVILEDQVSFRINYWGNFLYNQLHPMIISPQKEKN